MYDVAVIGAGVIGTATARTLSKYRLKYAYWTRKMMLRQGGTKIVHAGFGARPARDRQCTG